jgi:hypothetical protein
MSASPSHDDVLQGGAGAGAVPSSTTVADALGRLRGSMRRLSSWLEVPWIVIPAAAIAYTALVHAAPAGLILYFLDVPVVFAAAACAIALVAWRWPTAREPVHLLVGAGLFVWLSGWQYVAVMVGLTWLVHRFAHRFQPHLAMAIVAALTLVAAHLGVLFPAGHHYLVGMFAGLAVLRLVYYAFEARIVPRGERSFLRLLVFGPFCVPMTFGPRQVAYSDFMSEEPVVNPWGSGSVQMFRGLLKLAMAMALLAWLHRVLPDPRRFVELAYPARAAMLFVPYVLVALFLGAVADIGAGLSRWAGYGVEDDFNWNVLAATPIDWWQRSNLNLLQFLRRAFIFEALRFRRSWLLAAFAGASGATVYFYVKRMVESGPGMDRVIARTTALDLLALPAMLLLGLLMERALSRAKRFRWGRAGFVVVTQVVMASFFFPGIFGTDRLGYRPEQQLSARESSCSLASILLGTPSTALEYQECVTDRPTASKEGR